MLGRRDWIPGTQPRHLPRNRPRRPPRAANSILIRAVDVCSKFSKDHVVLLMQCDALKESTCNVILPRQVPSVVDFRMTCAKRFCCASNASCFGGVLYFRFIAERTSAG